LLSDSSYVGIYVSFTMCIVRIAYVAFSQKIVSTACACYLKVNLVNRACWMEADTYMHLLLLHLAFRDDTHLSRHMHFIIMLCYFISKNLNTAENPINTFT